MRFTTLLYAGVIALASAQTTPATTSTPTATNAGAPAQNSQQAAITACLNACKDGDVACEAKCVAVPNPNPSDVEATNKCVAACPKGSGTATDNQNYANCVEGCIGQHFLTETAGAPQATGSGTGAAPSGSGTRSGTGGPAPSSTNNAAAGGMAMAGSTAGFVGFLAALLAI